MSAPRLILARVEQPKMHGLGARGEDEAAEHYGRQGYRVLARNWRCRLGEIDLVLVKGATLVFCEVKTRRGSSLGGPYEAVTWKKQRTLRRLAEAFLAASAVLPAQVRFDVASVTLSASGRPSLHVYENAF